MGVEGIFFGVLNRFLPRHRSAASEKAIKPGVKKKRCGKCRKWKTTECECPRKSVPKDVKRATKSVSGDFMTDTTDEDNHTDEVRRILIYHDHFDD